jgi:vacuolar-type H+-ATPase subunit H
MKLHPTLPSWYRMLRGSSTGKTTMFTVRLSRRELQAENESLRAALEQAKVSLAEFRLQEHDLADVLVGARAEARDLVESARTEARDLVERAQTEARELSESARTEAHAAVEGARVEARGLTERATEEARQLREATQSEVSATLAEVENTERQLLRLRGMQRELEASLQQSLAALAPVLSFAAEAAPRPAATPARTSAAAVRPVPLAPLPVASASLPVAPVLLAPVPVAAAPAAPVPVAPVTSAGVEPVPVLRAALSTAQPVPPPEIKSERALEIFPLEIGALRPFERTQNRSRVAPRPRARVWSIRFPKAPAAKAGAAGAVIAIGLVAWSAWGARERADQTDAAAMVPSAAPAASSASTGPAAPTTASSGGGSGRAGSLATKTDVPPTRSVGRLTQAAPGLFTVVVEAVRPVWVRADTDGRRELARAVRAGERVELHAAREVILRAGDAGAVLASVNGGARAPLGADGTVITRRIAGPAATSTAKPAGAQRLLEAVASREPAGDANDRSPDAVEAVNRPTGAQARQRGPVAPEPPVTTPDIPLPSAPSGPALASPGPRTAAASAAAAPSGNPAPSPAAPSPLSPTETEVFGAHETYFDALRRGDQTTMGKVMAPNFTATGVPAPVGTDSLAVNSISVQVSGVGAVVSGVASRRDSGTDGRTAQLLFSEVWTNAGGQWQLLSVRFIEAPKK